MYKPIAIIGISFELPGIKGWSQLSKSLSNKKVNIGELSSNRLNDITQVFGDMEMGTGGFFERIDLFDNEYFNATEREAIKMFPEHRYFLSHALKAFYNAGYSEEKLKGSNTGIFFTESRSPYVHFLQGQYDFFDALPGLEGTRLANFLDLRGPVMAVNTTCSSSLAAAHNACLSLNQKECDLSLVGGVKFGTITRERANDFVVMSNKGECRPFDKDADGMMNGEGVICMVLKRLEDAERDNDAVYGVIEGSAVNHGGARISSLTAPSVEAQKEVILKAWENANANPNDIRFIEAHGTGTILGDPIEFSGIAEAFAEKNVTQSTCSISSIKAQVGHLDTMCGMAGLLRLIVAMHNKTLPAQANFATLNEHIEENESAIKIQTEAEPWQAVEGKRIGGVSSFGLTGTNVHMVVSLTEKVGKNSIEPYPTNFIQISGQTEERLENLKLHLSTYLQQYPQTDLSVFSNKINTVYSNGKHKEGILFSGREDLLNKLNSKTSKDLSKPVCLILDLDILDFELNNIELVLAENVLIKIQWDKHIGENISPTDIKNSAVLNVLFQFVLYKYLMQVMAGEVSYITRKGEGMLQQLLNGKIAVQEIINNPELVTANENEFNYPKFLSYLSATFKDSKIIIIDFSKEQHLDYKGIALDIALLNGSFAQDHRYMFYKVMLQIGRSPLKVNNSPHFLHDLQLPNFKMRRIWPSIRAGEGNNVTTQHKNETPKATPKPAYASMDLAAIQSKVKAIWISVLEIEGDIQSADDFFELGGSSLTSLDMLSSLENEFGKVNITYEEMFEFSTLGKLSQALHERLNNKPPEEKTGNNNPMPQTSSEGRKEGYQSLISSIVSGPAPKIIDHGDILVTGATGLIGSFLVKKLLEETDVNIVCLVRASNDEDAFARLRKTFKENFDQSLPERIRVVKGDAAEENLSINPQKLHLLKSIDVVYHLAGSPSFTGSVMPHDHINYLGTKNVYKWAKANGIKYFNHFSSIGVVGKRMPKDVKYFFETDIDLGQDTTNFIHMSTKLLAEEYLNNQRANKDMAINIFRIPNVGGRLSDGHFPGDMDKNFMYLKLKSLARIGCYSDEASMDRIGLKLAPVDVVVDQVYHLSTRVNGLLDTFNLDLQTGISMDEIVNGFDKAGLYLSKVSKEDLQEKVNHLQNTSDDYILGLKKHGEYYNTDQTHDYEIFSTATAECLKKIEIVNTDYDKGAYIKNVISHALKANFLENNKNQLLHS